MIIKVNDERYFTNINDVHQLNKCKEFFSDGCTSYAISFNNLPKDVITKMKVDKMECYVLRGFNFDFMFVPEKVKDIREAKELLSKGLDLIELL